MKFFCISSRRGIEVSCNCAIQFNRITSALFPQAGDFVLMDCQPNKQITGKRNFVKEYSL